MVKPGLDSLGVELFSCFHILEEEIKFLHWESCFSVVGNQTPQLFQNSTGAVLSSLGEAKLWKSGSGLFFRVTKRPLKCSPVVEAVLVGGGEERSQVKFPGKQSPT